MSTLIVADKVKIMRGCRMNGRQDGGFPRIADGAGRESGMDVGVVGRLEIQVALSNGRGRQVGHLGRVGNRRITLQKHLFLQTEFEDLRHNGAFVRVRRFLFNQRCQRHDLVKCFAGLAEVLLKILSQDFAETSQHRHCDVRGRGVVFKPISVREQVTLKRGRLWIEVPDWRRVP